MQNIPSKKIRISQKRLIYLINDCNPSKDPVEQEKVEKLEKIFDPDPNFNVLDFLEEIDRNLDNYRGDVFFQKVLLYKKTTFDPEIKKYGYIQKESEKLTQLVYATCFHRNRLCYHISIKRAIQFHTSRLKDFFEKKKEINLSFNKKNHSTNIFYMKKRSGGYRKIYVPNENLRNEQIKIKRVLDDLLYQIEKKFDLDFSFAYKIQKSIKHNVIPHQNSNFFLKIDLQNFFDSISPQHLSFLRKNTFQSLKPNINFINLLKEIEKFCFFKGKDGQKRAVQGYVTSPTISNLIMVEFDLKMKELVTDQDSVETLIKNNIHEEHKRKLKLLSIVPLEEQEQLLKKSILTSTENLRSLEKSGGLKLIYTRYSDDITISFENDFGQSEKIYEYIINYIQKTISEIYEEKIKINQKKIRKLRLKDGAVTITGIRIIPSEDGNLLAPSKRIIQETEFLINLSNKHKLSRDKINKLKGLLSFIKDISESEWKNLIYKCKENTLNLLNQQIKVLIEDTASLIKSCNEQKGTKRDAVRLVRSLNFIKCISESEWKNLMYECEANTLNLLNQQIEILIEDTASLIKLYNEQKATKRDVVRLVRSLNFIKDISASECKNLIYECEANTLNLLNQQIEILIEDTAYLIKLHNKQKATKRDFIRLVQSLNFIKNNSTDEWVKLLETCEVYTVKLIKINLIKDTQDFITQCSKMKKMTQWEQQQKEIAQLRKLLDFIRRYLTESEYKKLKEQCNKFHILI